MRIALIIITCLLSFPCFAADYYYCTHSNNYVHLGDSYSQVLAVCGNPISESKEKVQPTETRQVIQWIYDYNPQKTMETGVNHEDENVLVIEISNDKVISIVVEGKDVTQTNFCRKDATPLKIGQSSYLAEFLCGFATTKRTIDEPISKTPIEQDVLSYQINSLYPEAKLYFQQGKLIKIED